MYVPAHFRIEDLEELHAIITSGPLGALVTHGPAGFEANHIPFVLHRDIGAFGTLRAHLARANPQLARIAAGDDALVVFCPADGYVTPSWYPSKAEHGKVVPTWNFLAVHATGHVRLVEDDAWLAAHLDALTRQQEAGREHPWTVADAPDVFVRQQMRAIVGIEITIRDLVGKKKVGQNRTPADRAGLASAWASADDPASRLMREHLAPYVAATKSP